SSRYHSLLFSSQCGGALPDLPSFPTRRSSDLEAEHAFWMNGAERLPPGAGQAYRRVVRLREGGPLLNRYWDDLPRPRPEAYRPRSEEHTSELQSRFDLVCRLLLEKKKTNRKNI